MIEVNGLSWLARRNSDLNCERCTCRTVEDLVHRVKVESIREGGDEMWHHKRENFWLSAAVVNEGRRTSENSLVLPKLVPSNRTATIISACCKLQSHRSETAVVLIKR